MTLQSITAALEARLAAPAAVSAVIAQIRRRLDARRIGRVGRACTYARYVGEYASIQVLIAKAARHGEPAHVANGLQRLRSKKDAVRKSMYAAPCRRCAACVARRKPWPEEIAA